MSKYVSHKFTISDQYSFRDIACKKDHTVTKDIFENETILDGYLIKYNDTHKLKHNGTILTTFDISKFEPITLIDSINKFGYTVTIEAINNLIYMASGTRDSYEEYLKCLYDRYSDDSEQDYRIPDNPQEIVDYYGDDEIDIITAALFISWIKKEREAFIEYDDFKYLFVIDALKDEFKKYNSFDLQNKVKNYIRTGYADPIIISENVI